jgi:PAS domain S-box-containing protein
MTIAASPQASRPGPAEDRPSVTSSSPTILDSLFESVPLPCFLIAHESQKIIAANAEGRRLWEPGALGESTWFGGLFEADDAARARAAVALLEALGGGPVACSLRLRAGGQWTLRVAAHPSAAVPDGRLVCLVPAEPPPPANRAEPVVQPQWSGEERTAALAALVESESRFRRLADAAPVMMWALGVGLECHYVNQAWLDFTGLSRSQAHGQGWLAAIHPDDRNLWLDGHRDAANRHARFTREVRLRRHDGTSCWVLNSEAPQLTEQGELLGFIGIAQDISERRAMEIAIEEREAQIRSAIEAAQLGIWEWELTTGRVSLAGHSERMLGLAPGSFDGSFEGFIDRVHPEDRPGVNRALTTALTARTDYGHEHRVVWPDGRVRWIMVRGQCHFDPEGRPVRMIGAAMDVTSRRILEQQLVQAQKLEAIGSLAAGIAHEINTPTQYLGDNLRFLQDSFGQLFTLQKAYRTLIAVMEGRPELQAVVSAERLADAEYLETEIPRAITQSLDGLAQVAHIVSAMKEFSHPGTREKVPVDLNRLVTNTVAVARNEWKYVAEVELDLAPDLPPVPCLPGEIQQTVLNLTVNAAHAIADRVGPSGPRGTITIRTAMAQEVVELTVTDTGTGIPLEIQPRIFDPFFTTKAVGRGTGQGLAIAHDVVVNKHAGWIGFTTEPGRGATFTVRLPLHPADVLGPEL